MVLAGLIHGGTGNPFVLPNIVNIDGRQDISDLNRTLAAANEDVRVLIDANSGESSRSGWVLELRFEWTAARDVGNARQTRLLLVVIESVHILIGLHGELLLDLDGCFTHDAVIFLQVRVVAEQRVLELVSELEGEVELLDVAGDLAAARRIRVACITVAHI